jgi:hypothetical protein
MSSQRRNSLSDSQKKRPSLKGTAVRRSSKKLTQHNTLEEMKVQLARVAKEEGPSNRKERRERRASRKEDFATLQEHRTNRMGDIKDKWQDHRKSFISEQEELDRLMKENRAPWSCCGVALCCGW